MNALPLRAQSLSPLLMRALLLSAAFLLLNGCRWFGPDEDYTPPPPGDDRPWILVDIYHTDIQNPEDYRLHRDQYNYQGSYGFHRLFEHLENNDYPWRSIRTMPLSEQRLEGYSILFINLLHERNPDFTDEEVELIIEFVENGGGLFVIADHTNVYRHAERINRFLIPMGIEVMYHTAVDRAPRYSISGSGWITMFNFADHPVTEGLTTIGFKTGGPLKTEHGVAFTSDESFADLWDEEMDAGFYGDWVQGDDHELEPSGPLAVVAAAEFGQGRVAVVGDQNIFGDGWLNFGNNFELATNIVEWLAKNEDAEHPLRLQKRKGHNVAYEGRVSYLQPARTHRDGYYWFFIESNRNEEITARVTPTLETFNTDTLFLLSSDIKFASQHDDLNQLRYEEEELDEIAQYLEEGGQVVISFEADKIEAPTIQLLERLAPDFEIIAGDSTWSLDDPDSFSPPRREGFFPVSSPFFELDDLRLGSLQSFPTPNDNCGQQPQAGQPPPSPCYPADYESLKGYLFDVQVPWGESFVEADLGDGTATIARRALVGDGELIIFVQDGFFRNRTLGTDELLRPRASFRVRTVDFQHRFLDYLRLTAEK